MKKTFDKPEYTHKEQTIIGQRTTISLYSYKRCSTSIKSWAHNWIHKCEITPCWWRVFVTAHPVLSPYDWRAICNVLRGWNHGECNSGAGEWMCAADLMNAANKWSVEFLMKVENTPNGKAWKCRFFFEIGYTVGMTGGARGWRNVKECMRMCDYCFSFVVVISVDAGERKSRRGYTELFLMIGIIVHARQ